MWLVSLVAHVQQHLEATDALRESLELLTRKQDSKSTSLDLKLSAKGLPLRHLVILSAPSPKIVAKTIATLKLRACKSDDAADIGAVRRSERYKQ